MEGCDRPDALDLVGMAARLRQGFSEQSLGRPIAQQQQPLGLGEPDVRARDFRAGRAILWRPSSRRGMEADSDAL